MSVFAVVFGIFLVVLAALVVLTIRWAILRDRDRARRRDDV